MQRFKTSAPRLLLRRKKLFDAAFYLERYPDVAAARMRPFAHYLLHGAAEGRKPNPWFDPDYYLAASPEARERGGDPFIDFLQHGAKEHSKPHPLFDGVPGNSPVTEGAQFKCDS